jgi:hypothetical protein
MESDMRHQINTDRYVWVHGKQPKGTGMWAFEVTRRVEYADCVKNETAVRFAPRPMSFTEAKAWVRHNLAGNRDIVTVSVGS